jgi:hypothetical protein
MLMASGLAVGLSSLIAILAVPALMLPAWCGAMRRRDGCTRVGPEPEAASTPVP